MMRDDDEDSIKPADGPPANAEPASNDEDVVLLEDLAPRKDIRGGRRNSRVFGEMSDAVAPPANDARRPRPK